MTTTHHQPVPDVALPPGVMYDDPWELDTDTGRQSRLLNGATRGVPGNSDIQVYNAAVQYADGTLAQDALNRPSVWIYACEEALSSGQARALAAELIAAADELDGWAER
ncbi:hypothetical protein [Mycobacterium kansasii]|uniref:Uncharacterized protein n=1 Tax=Mycobacterium kansasii TaxID=1768 RepID=A0A1V3XHT6_MYCKA|nr:hypothetical protein BZL30_1982 [Mycobacterium kansasii]